MPDATQTAKTYAPSDAMVAGAHVDAQTYTRMYEASISDPDGFWRDQAKRVDWIKPFTSVQDVDFTLGKCPSTGLPMAH
jgi:acetyl-CoA synthetase